MNHSTSHSPVKKPGSAWNYFRLPASYLIAGACLFWVFHNIHLDQLWRGLAHIQWGDMAVCVMLQLLAYFCVAWEWQWLLRPAGCLPLRRAAQAVFAGRFANDALPFQLGYLVRAILAARWLGVSVVSIFPSLIVERLWDGIWLTMGIGLVALLVPLPPFIHHAAEFLGGTVTAGAAATVFLAVRHARTRIHHPVQRNFGCKPIQRLLQMFQRLANGLSGIGRPRLLAAVCGLSALKLGIQAITFLGLLWAYGLDLPSPVGLAVFLVGYLGICVPSTPAGTGIFQLSVVGALTFFGVSKSVAAGFALAAFAAITVPPALAGFFALAQSGLRLRDVRIEAVKFKKNA